MELTPKQRFLYTVHGQEPDYIPISEFLYSRSFYREILGYIPEYYNTEDVVRCSIKVGYDFVTVTLGGFSGMTNQENTADEYTDEWGIGYRKSDLTWPADAPVKYPLKNRNDWNNYDFPDPDMGDRASDIVIARKMVRDSGMAVVGTIRGPFTPAWLLFGITDFSMLIYDDPELIHEVMGKCSDFFLRGAELMVNKGADAILFADDYGFNSASLISPSHFRKFVLPYLYKYKKRLGELGVPLIMHSDGNIAALLDMIIDAGISGYNPVEKSAGMDMKELRERYRSNILLWGNIDNKTTLVNGTVEDVKIEVKECIRSAIGGGHILSSDHSIHDDSKNENVLALYESGRNFGKFPIQL